MSINIRLANFDDAIAINKLTTQAFKVYQNELNSATTVKALNETVSQVTYDITYNRVFVAEDNGKIVGSIRYSALSSELAYIFRFGVDPNISSTGVGSNLLKVALEEIQSNGFKAVALHTNAKYYKLARYYYGKKFFVHSTNTEKGYIRALFIKEFSDDYDISPAYKM